MEREQNDTLEGSVDDTLEDSVDDTHKDSVDDIIEDPVDDTLEDPVDDTLEDTLEDSVDDTLEDSVDDTLEDSVDDTLEDSVDDTLEDSVDATLEDRVDDPLEDPADDTLEHSEENYSVAVYTIQCNDCTKWRLIPSKKKYEEIREHNLEQPFSCEKAREWRPSISCNDEPDISQDDSMIWAMDKPNIPQPPSGWERLLRIRSAGCTIVNDVCYKSPCGKILPSTDEIQKYLQEHPEYIDAGVNMSQFSFQSPKPLPEDFAQKKKRKLG